MRKRVLFSVLAAVFLLLMLSSCSIKDKLSLDRLNLDRFLGPSGDVNIPTDYISCEEYNGSGTETAELNYGKYLLESAKEMDDRVEPTNYDRVTRDDIQRIIPYFNDFSARMTDAGRSDEYDFDPSVITAGDIVYVKTMEGRSYEDGVYGKYDSYTVYLFDRQSLTLYVIHSCI